MTADTHFFPNFPPKLTHPILNDGGGVGGGGKQDHLLISGCGVPAP